LARGGSTRFGHCMRLSLSKPCSSKLTLWLEARRRSYQTQFSQFYTYLFVFSYKDV
jgi:hypothetical protein